MGEADEPNGSSDGGVAHLSQEAGQQRCKPTEASGEHLFRAVAVVLFRHLQQALHEAPGEDSKIFDEEHFQREQCRLVYPLLSARVFPLTPFTIKRTKVTIAKRKVPSIEEISSFLQRISVHAMLSSECIVICLIYIERLMQAIDLRLRKENWRPIVLTALLLASKVWEDVSSWTAEFSQIAPDYSVRGINQMEAAFLAALKFRCHVSGQEYARYYFALRSQIQNRHGHAQLMAQAPNGIGPTNNFRAKYLHRSLHNEAHPVTQRT